MVLSPATFCILAFLAALAGLMTVYAVHQAVERTITAFRLKFGVSARRIS